MYKMRLEYHLNKAKRFITTMSKLDYKDDYETLIEDYLLAAAHYINAVLHKLHKVKEDKDVKHNQLSGYIRRENYFDESSSRISELIQQLEQLRPSHVYGKGENGNTAKRAEEIFLEIKKFCEELLK